MYTDIDDYGWLNKEEDCPNPINKCSLNTCELFDSCYIRIVEQARREIRKIKNK